MSLTTSVTLLNRVRQRDDAAWDRFLALYTPLLYRWALRIGLPEQEAGDLVQDVLVVLMTELPDFEYAPEKGSFRGWLKTLTLNKCRESFRGRHAAGIGGSGDLLAGVLDTPEVDPFWEREYRQHVVRRALDLMQSEFEESTWRACCEHLLSGRSAADVGRELGMSEGAVYVAKSRVLKRLRQELGGLLD